MARTKPTTAAEQPEGPVATEPGCTHPECVLEHPHAGPAILTQASPDTSNDPTPPTDDVDQAQTGVNPAGDAAQEADDVNQVRQRVTDAQAALDEARALAAARLPSAGYVIATEALYVTGGARAHLRGDRVPVGNVSRNGWEHLVRPPGDGE